MHTKLFRQLSSRVLWLWICCIGTLSFHSLQAETPFWGIPQIQYFNRSEYGGGTQNWSISQSDKGLVYVANNFGIMEFDGTSWRLLPSASQSITRAVLAVGERVYAGANDEFGYYETVDGRDMQYESLNKLHTIKDIGDFWGIFLHNDMVVFQSEKALCLYKPDKSIEVVYARSRIPNAFSVNGMLLVHDELEGLMELRQGRLFNIPGGEKFAGVRLGAVLSLPNDELVIGTMTNGLYRYGKHGISKWEVPANSFFIKNNVFCGTRIGTDLVFGTIQSGIVIVDVNGRIKAIVSKDKGLRNNTVLGVFVDRDNNIWAGLDNGISKIAYHSTVSYIQGYYDLGTGYCMARRGEQIYLGTNQGLYVIDKQTLDNPDKDRNSFKRVEGTSGQIWSVYKDKMGNLLCGHNVGVFKINGSTSHSISPPSVMGAWVFRYVPNRNDLLMVGTYKGLVLFRLSGGEWQFAGHVKGFDESSRFMEWDGDGGLWVAHGLKGLFKLYFSDDYLSIVKINSNADFSGLENDRDMTLALVNGRLVFVSAHGIFQFETAKGTFQPHALNTYFTRDKISTPNMLLQDDERNIWYFSAGNAGVLRHQEDGTYRRISNPFFSLNGKMVNGFESVFMWDNKNVLFGIEDGFAHYAVTDRTNVLIPFYAHIRGFSGATGENGSYYVSYSREEIKIQPNIPSYPFADNAFDVSYSASWNGEGRVDYSTLLEGFEENWTDWSASQKRQFTRLPEGEYTFWVKARNINGVESEPAGFRFVVMPPWYRSVWAKITYAIVVLGALLLFWGVTRNIVEKSRDRAIRKQQENFRITEEKLRHDALVSEKEMIRLRNEKLRNEMLHKEKELANSAMHVVHKNEFLIKIKEDLQKALGSREFDGLAKRIGQVLKRIDNDIDNESHWEIFETHLEQVHEDFLKRLQEKHIDLMPRELKLCAYLRMGMSSKEIASLMNISARAVENNRYKLRKKLELDQGESLLEYIISI